MPGLPRNLRDSRTIYRHPNAFFMAHVQEQDNGCWKWIGRLSLGLGYGMVYDPNRKRQVGAHRYAYELFVGPIPSGLHIDHLCNNRRCVNPQHLEAVTQRENTLRGQGAAALNARKTHCPRGHEYTPENVYLQGPNRTNRVCKLCARERNRRAARKLRTDAVVLTPTLTPFAAARGFLAGAGGSDPALTLPPEDSAGDLTVPLGEPGRHRPAAVSAAFSRT